MTETNRIEYKEKLTKDLDIEKEAIAFLNYHEGGIIFIGINKHGIVLGVSNMDTDMLKIKSNTQQLSFEQLKIYYEAKGINLNSKFTRNLELLTQEGELNYVAYLMADNNGNSIKVAKYGGKNRVDLIENEDFGYCSLIKATKSVLNKIDLENKTITQITSKERKEQRSWDSIAIREAVLNAFVHNDYTTDVPPKFEIFENRIEITSIGGLPNSLSQEEFFEGYSVPRNKELMRIFKDLDLVEQLGSGIPLILEYYGK